jgi:hypothetical protein
MLYTSNTNKKRYLFKHVAGTGTVGTNRRLHLMFVVNFRGNRYRVPIFFCLKFSILLKRNFLSTAGVRRMQKPVINSFFLAGCWPRTQMKINRRAGLSTTCGLEKHVRTMFTNLPVPVAWSIVLQNVAVIRRKLANSPCCLQFVKALELQETSSTN